MSETNGDNKAAIPELSVEVQLIEARLAKTAMNEIVPYSELSAIAGKDIQSPTNRWIIYRAWNRLLRDKRMVFAAVKGVGAKRLDDSAIATAVPESTVGRIRKAARRGLRKMGTLVYENLKTPEERMACCVNGSILRIITESTKPSVRRAIECQSEGQKNLVMTKALAAMVEAVK